MKKGIILTAISVLSILSCTKNKDKADAYGTFETTETTVSSLANGKILWLNLEEGQVFDSGKLVGMIDTLDFSLKISQAREQQAATAARQDDLSAQIEIQEQNKANALVDKDRIENMLKDGAATTKQLDDVNATLRVIDKQIALIKSQFVSLRAQIATYDRQIAELKKSIEDAHIINPVKGTVLTKYAESGEVATFGKPLYKIADLSYLDLRVYVSGDQLAYIKPGQKVEVRYDKSVEHNFVTSGVVTWISETAEFTPKTIQTKEERVNLVYAVKVSVKNDGSLKIGMPGEIKFMPVK